MERPPFRSTAAIATALGVAAFVLYVATAQRGFWSDGMFYYAQIERGDLRSQYVLYLPIIAGTRALLSPFGLTLEGAIKLVSAFGGGVCVATGYVLARAVLRSAPRALAAASLLALLPGMWFNATATEVHAIHAACAGIATVGLAFSAANLESTLSLAAVAVGGALGPSTHPSGASVALPALAALVAAKRKLPLMVALAIGAGISFVLYELIAAPSPAVSQYGVSFRYVYFTQLFEPGRVQLLLREGSAEILLFSVPASCLLAVGLRQLGSRARAVAWVFGLTIAGYVALCLPIYSFEWGCYYVPTFTVEAILAVVALERLAISWPRAGIAVALSAVPSWITLHDYARTPGTIAVLVCAPILFLLALGRPRPELPRAVGLASAALVAIAFAFSMKLVVPLFFLDPTRDFIRAVEAYTAPQGPSAVFFMEGDGLAHESWKRFYRPGAAGVYAENLLMLDVVPPERRDEVRADFRNKIEERLARGEPVWLAGDPIRLVRGHAGLEFLEELKKSYELESPPGAPAQLLRIRHRS